MMELLNHAGLLNLGMWLVHFTWQGALLALLLRLILQLSTSRSAELRYMLCWTTLLVMLAAPGITTYYFSAQPIDEAALVVSELSAEHTLHLHDIQATGSNLPAAASAHSATAPTGSFDFR